MHMVWMAGLRGVIAFICALGFPKQVVLGQWMRVYVSVGSVLLNFGNARNHLLWQFEVFTTIFSGDPIKNPIHMCINLALIMVPDSYSGSFCIMLHDDLQEDHQDYLLCTTAARYWCD